MDYYSATKRTERLTPTATPMDLEDMMLSERRQSQRDTHYMIPRTGGSEKSHICAVRNVDGGCPGLGDRVSVGTDRHGS